MFKNTSHKPDINYVILLNPSFSAETMAYKQPKKQAQDLIVKNR